MSDKTYTKKEFKEFDKLTWDTGSRDQMTRLRARLALRLFIEKHGQEKCDLMFTDIMAKGKHL